jgi:hypothetical protein
MAIHYQNRMPRQSRASQQSMSTRCREMTEATIQRYPMGVSLAVFGVGLGLGTLVGSLLAGSCAARDRRIAEGLGRRMLHSLERIVPERLPT